MILANRSVLEEEPRLATVLQMFAGEVDKAVDYGSSIFELSSEAIASKGNGVDLSSGTVLMMFRHSLELIDSISVMIRHSTIDPCKVQLRAVLEVLLNISYILKKDTNSRSAAFVVWDTHRRLIELSKINPKTQLGKKFQTKLKKDKFLSKTVFPSLDRKQIANEGKRLKDRLKQPAYREAEAEHQNLRISGRNSPHWYSFHGGPTSLEQVAHVVEMPAMYELLYRNWSGHTHGTDIFDNRIRSVDGKKFVLGFRLPFDAQITTSITLSLLFKLLEIMIRCFLPNEESDYAKWYLHDMREAYNRIALGSPLITIKDT